MHNKIGADNRAPRLPFHGFGYFIHLVAGSAAPMGSVSDLARTMKTISIFLFVAIAIGALAAEKLIDDKLAAKAEVVLRVKRLTPGEGSKYLRYGVEVLQVLKNRSGETFTNTLSVAAYSWKAGVPDGESTLYLERYNEADKKLWRLVGGEASTGVSHVKKQ